MTTRSLVPATMSEAVRLFRAKNDAGEGYAPPDGLTSMEDTIASYVASGCVLEMPATNDSEVVVMSRGDHVIAIGDVHGAWVVTLGRSHETASAM